MRLGRSYPNNEVTRRLGETEVPDFNLSTTQINCDHFGHHNISAARLNPFDAFTLAHWPSMKVRSSSKCSSMYRLVARY